MCILPVSLTRVLLHPYTKETLAQIGKIYWFVSLLLRSISRICYTLGIIQSAKQAMRNYILNNRTRLSRLQSKTLFSPVIVVAG